MTEVTVDGQRYRYRESDLDTATYSARFEVEYWHESRQEWRPLQSWAGRDWFAIGFAAGRRVEGQCELPLAAPPEGP